MKGHYKIRADADRIIGRVNPNIYGHFIEHLGRCIYKGIYEENSPLSDNKGFRKDVLQAVKNIKCPLLRWPGGNFASNYHWEDGIGSKDKRPIRFDLAWNKEETNRFGTDEFIEYCRAVRAEPHICINIGTGSLDEGIHWLEYCNSTGNTYHAKLRKKYGHPQSYKVKYWGIGNENWGEWQVGYRSAKEYAKVLREYAKFMKVVDPNIEIIAVGGDNPDWDLEVINIAGEYIDYISNHQYRGSNDYYETVASVYWIERRLKILSEVIDIAQPLVEEEEKIKIALDEWNVQINPENNQEKNYTLQDGLFTAGVLIVLHRLCRVVTMANFTFPVNTAGAIRTGKHGLYLTPVYRAFELFANHTGEIALDTLVTSQTYDSETMLTLFTSETDDIKLILDRQKLKLSNIHYLDASVSLNRNRDKLFIAAVNYHQEEDIDCSIFLRDFSPKRKGKVYELNGPDMMAVNDFNEPEKIKIREKTFENGACRFSYIFPAHSATVIELEV